MMQLTPSDFELILALVWGWTLAVAVYLLLGFVEEWYREKRERNGSRLGQRFYS